MSVQCEIVMEVIISCFQKAGPPKAYKLVSFSVLQSLCHEIKQRRRGVASILRLCQHLLDDRDTCNLNADHQPMQLIIVNLERRWEAIVMQAVQWQTRLQKKMGKEPVSVIPPHNWLCFILLIYFFFSKHAPLGLASKFIV